MAEINKRSAGTTLEKLCESDQLKSKEARLDEKNVQLDNKAHERAAIAA